MREEIRDPGALEQTAEEIQIRLAVLHAILERLVVAREQQPVVAEIMPLDDRLEYLLDGLVLKDAAIGGAAQEPEPRLQPQLIAVQLPRGLSHAGGLLAGANEACDQPIEGPHRSTGEPHR